MVIAQKHLCGRSFHGFATEEKGVRMVKGGTTYIQTYVCIYIVCIYRERTCASLYIYIWRGAGAYTLHCGCLRAVVQTAVALGLRYCLSAP